MRDLEDMLGQGLDARERELAGLQPAAGDLSRVVHGVRVRRAGRHAAQGLVAVVVLGAVGGVGWWGFHRPEPVPAVTPTPTVTATRLPSPTPTPTPTPAPRPSATPTPTAPSPQPTTKAASLPGLGTVPGLTPDVFARVGPGWALAVYAPKRWIDANETQKGDNPLVQLANSVLLIAPDGTRYHVMDLPLSSELSLRDWETGSATVDGALVRGTTTRLVRLNLATAQLEKGPTLGSEDKIVAALADGRFVVSRHHGSEAEYRLVSFDGSMVPLSVTLPWSDFMPEPLVSPDGTRIVIPEAWSVSSYWEVDLTTSKVTRRTIPTLPGGRSGRCNLTGWFDGDSLLAACGDLTGLTAMAASQHVGVYRIVLGGAVTALGKELIAGEPVPETPSIPTPDGIVAGSALLSASTFEDGTAWLWTASGDSQQLPRPPDRHTATVPIALVGQDVYLLGYAIGEDSDLYPLSLWVLHDGKLVQLFPADITTRDGQLTQGLTWVVVCQG